MFTSRPAIPGFAQCDANLSAALYEQEGTIHMSKQATSRRNVEAIPTFVDIVPKEPIRTSRGETLIALMRCDGGVTAKVLAAAVGWQVHSIRGYIAGTLRKRVDLTITTIRHPDGARYLVQDAVSRTDTAGPK